MLVQDSIYGLNFFKDCRFKTSSRNIMSEILSGNEILLENKDDSYVIWMNKILYGVLSWWEIIQTCPISRQELLMKFTLNLFFIWFFVVFTKPPILVNEILKNDSHPVHLFLQRSFSSYMQKTCDVAILATKKIAEKVRKSRQNVNRDKSA